MDEWDLAVDLLISRLGIWYNKHPSQIRRGFTRARLGDYLLIGIRLKSANERERESKRERTLEKVKTDSVRQEIMSETLINITIMMVDREKRSVNRG